MHKCAPIILAGTATAIALTGSALAQDRQVTAPTGLSTAPDGGVLSTMPHGLYQCSLPGDATADPFTPVPGEDFRISPSSSYSNKDGSGIYIMRGRSLTFTRGPKKGQRFERIGTNQLQRLNKSGEPDRLICTRLSGSG